MTENHFRSHFLAISDQYATLFYFLFFTKWLPAAILDDRKSLSIAFLAISDQNSISLFFIFKMAARPFWMTENHFLSTLLAISDQYATFFLIVFSKWRPAAILKV